MNRHDKLAQDVAGHASERIATGLVTLAFEINNNLNRVAVALEVQAEMLQVDIEATIKNGVKAGIDDAVNQKTQETAKRSYIGKKPA